MFIRDGAISDVEDISLIHALSWKAAYRGIVPDEYLDDLKENYWVDAFTNWIKNDKVKVKVIIEADLPIGVVAYGKSRDESLPDFCEIISIYLLPKYFGQGLGKKLINAALDDIYHIGYKNVYLWVLEENLNAQNFYKSIGFSPTKHKLNCEIQGKKLTDIKFIYSYN